MFNCWQLLKNIYKHFMIPKHLDSAFRKPVWDLYFKIVWCEPGLGLLTIDNYSLASWILSMWCWGFILTVAGQVFDPHLEAAECHSLLSPHAVLSAHVGAWVLTAQYVQLKECDIHGRRQQGPGAPAFWRREPCESFSAVCPSFHL